MCITHKGQAVMLDQCAYLDKVLEHFSMTNAKSAPTPLPSNLVPKVAEGKASPELLRSYQSIIGSLLQWLKKMSQCLHDLERSAWCNLLT